MALDDGFTAKTKGQTRSAEMLLPGPQNDAHYQEGHQVIAHVDEI